MANNMMVIFPYLEEDTWVFDDDRAELTKEPFVCGIPEMIGIMVKDIPNAHQGFKMLFSQSPFPDYQVELVYLREEYGGNWYRWEEQDLEGWLCPAMFKYFTDTPANIYCQAQKVTTLVNYLLLRVYG